MEKLLLAIDGGGTNTDVALLNEAGVRHDAQFETTNHNRVGYAVAIERIFNAVSSAHEASGFSRESRIGAAVIGLAGIDTPEQEARMLQDLQGIAEQVVVMNDSKVLFGALPEQTGVVMIAGTGSIASGRNAAGQEARAGGHGHDYDEGSGTWVAHQALSTVAKISDNRLDPDMHDHAEFADEVLLAAEQSLGKPIKKFADLYDTLYRAEAYEQKAALYGDVTPRVFDMAESGIWVAQDILKKGAYELASLVKAVSGTLAMDEVELAVGGSLLTRRSMYRELLAIELTWNRREAAKLKKIHVVQKPIDAAVRMVQAAV